MDPGAFGTLGVGGGFALGAKLCRPDCDVWVIYGDGSVGYSIPEFDTFTRHKVIFAGVICLLLLKIVVVYLLIMSRYINLACFTRYNTGFVMFNSHQIASRLYVMYVIDM